ncbi:MAG: Protein containing DUF519 [uncultured bacterium]|nr:MAG: Protein containing DUF519 [uncultured bacterium]OGT15901.1 MAG: hypothetical protein A3B69_02180 [Gammaproteobacteria bacterium RIFCSPHIGHO2_02_FULL_38_33]OGT24596.1 MAG: hypothetical protein A2W47_02950 [Gammaproteobacteria bacterium RIFCSPHIGHO2_12_38_15]OGT69026.1 MAG: hypothetical protein A3I12_01630 [Gammaproteobacteria bacterium RIFCSPLOWO2_02_FULL_38_11]OGT75751.1 MAG: hypothetical protein A3G71_01710 [Gammaproteobacteria bacterium RIFCSPLOWO2_12_FULL_38_14]
MNYLHAYHAGQAADLFKHFVLFELLKALLEKKKPLAYLETHAGFAYYDLKALPSQKTQSYQTGISLLWQAQPQTKLKQFFDVIKKLNLTHDTTTLRYYPGSAWIANQLLTRKNPLYLCDKNETAIHHLKTHLPRTAHLYHEDGYKLLTSLLPPKTKRGLLFIDPPYESDEWEHILQACTIIHKKWAFGTTAIWYPIKNDPLLKKFYRSFQELPFNKKENIEFCLFSKDVSQRLNGSGIFLINPPWKFKENIENSLQELKRILTANIC